MSTRNVLLSGIVGSTAYGLARPGSDVDRLGVFAVPTEELHGLHRPTESVVTHAPDSTLHEAGKWARLALAGNPTVMELVWLPPELYETRTPLGDELIGLRSAFLSAPRVSGAYLGYAAQQFERLRRRGDGSFSADTRKRTAKHARHLMRLLDQGLELYSTGHLTIRVTDPQKYHDFGDQVANDPDTAEPVLSRAEDAFAATRSPLPEQADEAAIEAWLRRVRASFYSPADTGAPSPHDAHWEIETLRHGIWSTWSGGIDDQAEARRLYDDNVVWGGERRAFRLIRVASTCAVEAEHHPSTASDRPVNDTTPTQGDQPA
ncbi:DNA polymerase beta superfamily protein [Streptomyces griseoluteus]|uniref:nucleotidyltransferase domain-containing protein n=1 Tax=Streptomyces griseoluteus TaxID=29306 RepID=UPI0038084DAB